MTAFYLRQLSIFMMALALAVLLGVLGVPWPLLWLQPPLALALAIWRQAPRWWWLLHLLMLPAIVLALDAQLPASVYLLGALLLFGLSRNVLTDRVPLFLTSNAVLDVLAARLPQHARLLDLGCGTGRLLFGLAQRRPDLQLHGVESAWLPWLWAWLRARLAGKPQVHITLGNLWQASLAGHEVIYAYLSPEPMARIWHKVQQEAVPGTWFISNSFAVPDVQPDECIPIDDATASTLFIWRLTT
jgi:hypothetical protein